MTHDTFYVEKVGYFLRIKEDTALLRIKELYFTSLGAPGTISIERKKKFLPKKKKKKERKKGKRSEIF
jgi:hypothetical protein